MTRLFARSSGLSAIASAGVFACALLGSTAALAQAPGTAARAQAERAVCDGVQQDKAACLREAGAAQQEAKRSGLTSAGPAGADQNAMARCQLQPPADRADCEARLKGSATGTTTTSGSVMGGGIVRETVTPIPAPAK